MLFIDDLECHCWLPLATAKEQLGFNKRKMQGRARTNVARKFNYPLFVFVLVIGFWGVVFFSCLIHMDGNTPCHGCSSRMAERLCQEQMWSSAAAQQRAAPASSTSLCPCSSRLNTSCWRQGVPAHRESRARWMFQGHRNCLFCSLFLPSRNNQINDPISGQLQKLY